MTTQADLIILAKTKHSSDFGIKTMLLGIDEAKGELRLALSRLGNQHEIHMKALDGAEGRSFGLNANDAVLAAAQVSNAVSCLNKHFINLACILQGLGEDINY